MGLYASFYTAQPGGGGLSSGGASPVNSVQLNYADTPVDDVDYTELIAATTENSTGFELFDGGGYPMQLAIGAAGAEIPLILVPPGGFDDIVPIKIPQGSRISIKCAQAGVTVTAGQLILTTLKPV